MKPISSVEVLALIPARCGSKGLLHKNIRQIAGKPLLAWTIESALRSERISRVIVSTDSDEYAELARSFGAETPFLRPAEIADDLSTDLECFLHALKWLLENESYCPKLCVHLRPTTPVRRDQDIDSMVDLALEDGEVDSVRSVVEVPHPPFKMWYRNEESGKLTPVVPELPGISEPWNQPRQALPKTYLHNGNIDVVRTDIILENHSMSGAKIVGFLQKPTIDIDSYEEFRTAEQLLLQAQENL